MKTNQYRSSAIRRFLALSLSPIALASAQSPDKIAGLPGAAPAPPPPPPAITLEAESGGDGPKKKRLIYAASGEPLVVKEVEPRAYPVEKLKEIRLSSRDKESFSADALIRESKLSVLQHHYATTFSEVMDLQRSLIDVEDPTAQEKLKRRLEALMSFLDATERHLQRLVEEQKAENEKSQARKLAEDAKMTERKMAYTKSIPKSEPFAGGGNPAGDMNPLAPDFGEKLAKMINSTVQSVLTNVQKQTEAAQAQAQASKKEIEAGKGQANELNADPTKHAEEEHK